jgi:hypothetical protein
MILIDKKENLEFGLSGDGFIFEDVKQAVLEFKKAKCYCTATAPFICDFCSNINKIFGDFEK